MFTRKPHRKEVNVQATKDTSAACDSPVRESNSDGLDYQERTFIRREELVDCFECGRLCWRFIQPVYVDDMRPSTKQDMANHNVKLISGAKTTINMKRERYFCKACRPAYDVIRLESDTKTRYFCFPKPAESIPEPSNDLVEVTEKGRPLPKKRTTRRRR